MWRVQQERALTMSGRLTALASSGMPPFVPLDPEQAHKGARIGLQLAWSMWMSPKG